VLHSNNLYSVVFPSIFFFKRNTPMLIVYDWNEKNGCMIESCGGMVT
jgi:hypothetical protein